MTWLRMKSIDYNKLILVEQYFSSNSHNYNGFKVPYYRKKNALNDSITIMKAHKDE